MTYTAGSRLGPYEILSPIGEGGMGQVWKARDTRLDRTVAIKTSLAQFDERFEREARAVAALNHPHICQLYDVGPNYLVMELVEGQAIKGPLPLDQALTIAIQLADALDAAHKKGITHRDLKPANALMTKSGVKVLDFGLAKFETARGVTVGGDSVTRMATQQGTIVGTLQYMAPEQLQGKDTVDSRADIFSFGCVLYEMLTGKRAFDGDNPASIIAAVMERPAPPVGDVAPQSLDRLLKRCFEKDPDKRWQSASDLMFELEGIASGNGAAVDSRESQPARKGRPTLWMVIAAASTLALAALASIHFRETPAAEPVLNASIPVPEEGATGFVALSPDGRRLALSLYSGGRGQLYVRSLDSPQFHLLANTDEVRAPFWSPDGKSIGFFANGKLKVIPAAGGPPQTLCDSIPYSGGTWSRDGVILFTEPGGSVSRVSASGGACTPLTKAVPGEVHEAPAFLPDSRHLLYTVTGSSSAGESKRGVFLASLDDPRGRRILADPVDVVYAPQRPGSPSAHLLFLRDSALTAQPFDERSLQTTGDPFVVAQQASKSPNIGTPDVSVSRDGLLVFIASRSWNDHMVWLDRSGKELAQVGSPGSQMGPALSPDGKAIAIARGADPLSAALWLWDPARNSESKFAEGGGRAVWSPDSSRIVYAKDNQLYLRDTSGGGAETPIPGNGNPRFPADWSRDGRFLFYTEIDPKTGPDIWYLENPPGGVGHNWSAPVRLPGSNANVRSQAQLSPDGHWLAYTSDESGAPEVYIRPFPNGSGQSKVSTGGGAEPRWSKDSKEIFYLRNESALSGTMMAASIRPGAGALDIGVPGKLFPYRSLPWLPSANIFTYSVAADGRFLMNVSADSAPPTIQMISNWQKLGTEMTPAQ